MQIKAILIHPPDWQKMKSVANMECWQGCKAKGILFYCWWACKLQQCSWQTVKAPHTLEKLEHQTWVRLLLAVLAVIAPNWKQPSILEWIHEQ